MKLLLHLFPFAFLFAGSNMLYSQQNPRPDSVAESNTILLYQKEMKLQSWLYNGIEEAGYGTNLIGSPYFLSDSLVVGTVMYEGNLYTEIPLMYDMIKDALIIKYRETPLRIRLFKDKITAFDIQGHHFVLISSKRGYNNLREGFYDQLYMGTVQFLVNRSALSNTIIEDSQVKYRIDKKVHYYFVKNSVAYPVNSIKSALKITGDKDHRIRSYLKKNKLKYRKDQEGVLLKIALLNDGLIKINN